MFRKANFPESTIPSGPNPSGPVHRVQRPAGPKSIGTQTERVQNPSGAKSIGSQIHRVFVPQGCNWLCEVLGHGRTIPQAAFAVHWQVFLAASTDTKRANATNVEIKVWTTRHSKMPNLTTGTAGSALGSATAAPRRIRTRKSQCKDYACCATTPSCFRR